MDWIFEVKGRRVFMRARENGSEERTHVALKLLGMLLLSDEDPQMEPRRSVHHRKYKPDVISGDGATWCEAGRVSMRKLEDLASVRSVERLMVMKRGYNAARDMARHFPSGTRADVSFYGWDVDAVQELADAVSGHSDVAITRVENDRLTLEDTFVAEASEVMTYRVDVDDWSITLPCLRFEPGCGQHVR